MVETLIFFKPHLPPPCPCLSQSGHNGILKLAKYSSNSRFLYSLFLLPKILSPLQVSAQMSPYQKSLSWLPNINSNCLFPFSLLLNSLSSSFTKLNPCHSDPPQIPCIPVLVSCLPSSISMSQPKARI